MERTPQNYENHTKWDPLFHFVLVPAVTLTLLWLIWRLIRHPAMEAVAPVLICLWAALAIFKFRSYSLKVQDRLIRLEERLRLASLLGEPLRARAAGLSESQLIALRFACDGELPTL